MAEKTPQPQHRQTREIQRAAAPLTEDAPWEEERRSELRAELYAALGQTADGARRAVRVVEELRHELPDEASIAEALLRIRSAAGALATMATALRPPGEAPGSPPNPSDTAPGPPLSPR